MRFFLLSMALIFATTACSKDETPKQAPQKAEVSETKTLPEYFSAIEPSVFQEIAESEDAIVIDIRTPQEIVQGKAMNTAEEIDLYAPEFRAQIENLDPEKTYLLYCRSGNRTVTAKTLMKNLGFEKVYDLKGGIRRWEQHGCKTICKK